VFTTATYNCHAAFIGQPSLPSRWNKNFLEKNRIKEREIGRGERLNLEYSIHTKTKKGGVKGGGGV